MNVSNAKKELGRLIACGVGAAVFFACFVACFLLSLFTGVVASCAAAPEWWIKTYFMLYYTIPIWGGFVVYRSVRGFLRWYDR